ncbi:hypothetical protein ABBQ32_002328 [Trebouxia sp. C0010 RCD-2024]
MHVAVGPTAEGVPGHFVGIQEQEVLEMQLEDANAADQHVCKGDGQSHLVGGQSANTGWQTPAVGRQQFVTGSP